MALEGTISTNAIAVPNEGGKTRFLKFSWSAETSATSSTSRSTINWNLKGAGSYGSGGSLYCTCHNIILKIKYDGEVKHTYTANSVDVRTTTTLDSGSFTLTHSGTSNKTFSVSIYCVVYYSDAALYPEYVSRNAQVATVTGNTAPTSSIDSTYDKTYGSITITPTISNNGAWATSISDKKVQMYSNGSWTNLGNFTSGSPYTINNLDPSTSYKFRLYVKNDTYKSSYSSVLTCTTDAFTRPSIPRSVTLSPTSDITSTSNYSLSWLKPSTVGDTNAMHYRFRIYAGINGSVADTNITVTSVPTGAPSEIRVDSNGVIVDSDAASYSIQNLNLYMTRNLNAGEYLTVILFAFKSYNNVNYYTRGASGSSIYVDSAGNCAVLKKVGPCQSGQARMWINTTNGWQNGLVFINDNGTWKPAKAVYVNDNGTWKKGT